MFVRKVNDLMVSFGFCVHFCITTAIKQFYTVTTLGYYTILHGGLVK